MYTLSILLAIFSEKFIVPLLGRDVSGRLSRGLGEGVRVRVWESWERLVRRSHEVLACCESFLRLVDWIAGCVYLCIYNIVLAK